MNRNKKKTKGIPKKLLALMLCCFCLVTMVPISASAQETETQTTGESALTSGQTGSENAETGGPVLETDEGTGTETNTETGSETGTETNTGTGSETGTETNTETGSETGTETNPETDAEANTGTAANNALDGYGTEPLAGGAIEPDPAFLWVTKTFCGLSEAQIPSDFSISVDGTPYALNKAERIDTSDGSIAYRWRVEVNESTTYQVKESGAEVEGYSLAAEPKGILEDNGIPVPVDANKVTLTWRKDYNSCSDQTFTLSPDGVFFIDGQKETIVISAAPLGMAAREAIIKEIGTFGGSWKGNISFYQISQYLGQTVIIGRTSFTISENGDTVKIGSTSEWQHTKEYKYDYEAAQSDITIKNTYTPNTCDLSISKTVGGNMGNRNEDFTFTATLGEGYSFEGVNYSIQDADANEIDSDEMLGGSTFGFTV